MRAFRLLKYTTIVEAISSRSRFFFLLHLFFYHFYLSILRINKIYSIKATETADGYRAYIGREHNVNVHIADVSIRNSDTQLLTKQRERDRQRTNKSHTYYINVYGWVLNGGATKRTSGCGEAAQSNATPYDRRKKQTQLHTRSARWMQIRQPNGSGTGDGHAFQFQFCNKFNARKIAGKKRTFDCIFNSTHYYSLFSNSHTSIKNACKSLLTFTFGKIRHREFSIR